ncbi:MAG: hypothetical protein DMG16_25980 [Acidobacteria bacterium]|nr:MAG: hypothetical protein DMG16_25980 [Acidobacteriota bacterium]
MTADNTEQFARSPAVIFLEAARYRACASRTAATVAILDFLCKTVGGKILITSKPCARQRLGIEVTESDEPNGPRSLPQRRSSRRWMYLQTEPVDTAIILLETMRRSVQAHAISGRKQ